MTVRAVIFDWGGTLTPHADVDLLELWLATAEHLDAANGPAIAAQLLAVEDRFWARTSTTQESGTLDDIIALAAQELGLEVADAVRQEAAGRHLDAWAGRLNPHDPDAAAVLGDLRRQGIRTGLLSNTHWPRRFHEDLLARDGLVDLLDVRLYSSELSHLKPHPSVFLAALEAVSAGQDGGPIAPQDAVFVGDRPQDDIAGAKGVGMRAVLRPNGSVPSGPVEPDATISSLPELLDLVARWR
jgi:FMN phosphatase YigB (HAD superfamily)